jgi:hypothetical protein
LTAQQLQSATGKSQPSISLALGKLGSEVCKLGAARSTRYALTQTFGSLIRRCARGPKVMTAATA